MIGAFVASALGRTFGEKAKAAKEKDPDGYDFKTKPAAEQVEVGEDEAKKSKHKKKGKLARSHKRATDDVQKGKLTLMGHEEEAEELKDAKEDKSQQICYLCKRNRPVFTGDDQLRRLPESTLSPFLKQLKLDSKEKQRYL